ncbi:MAG: HD domain-containing protein [Infirmifilum sp.]
MRPVKEIFDEIHGFIDLYQTEVEVLENCALTRLRHVLQLGPAYNVYPSATHTRYAHSLGTMLLADKLYSGAVSEPEQEERRVIRLAGLLHDVGHLPFSHALPGDHESLGIKIIKQYLADDLASYLETIIDVLKGRHELSPIISGEVDADRLDYLIRDAHHLGLPYKGVDLERVIRHARLVKLGSRWVMAFSEGSEVAVEALIITRLELFRRVYYHKHVTALEALLAKIYNNMIEENLLEPPSEIIASGEWCFFDDCFLLEKIKGLSRRGGWLGEASRMFLHGEIPVLVAEVHLPSSSHQDVTGELLEASAECGIPQEWVIVHIPKLIPVKDPDSLLIIRGDRLESIMNVNGSLLKALKDFAYSPVRVYTRREHAKRLRECIQPRLARLKP